MSRRTILDDALGYLALPVSVVPVDIGTKKPPARFRWKQFQTNIAPEEKVRDWFNGRDDLGVAIILGKVSGGLIARDFDTKESFQRWKDSHKSLAKSLPIVETFRGAHVYARCPGAANATFDDGELRCDRLIVVAPNSRHPQGGTYRWAANPLKSLKSIPIIDPSEAGFIPRGSATDISTDRTESVSVRSVSICGIDPGFLDGTIPPAYGTRRGRIFEVARRIKSDPALRDKPVNEWRPLMREWHRLALPTINTKDFDTTWLDFVEAMANIDPALCSDAALMALERVEANPLPRAAHEYDSAFVQMLVALCFQLSLPSSDGVFYLSCRKAAAVLGTTDFKLVARWLRLLCADGVLTEVTKGTASRATRFRWTGGKPDIPSRKT